MSKVTIDQFRAQVKPTRGSKLDPFRDEVLALYDEGYSLDQIMEFLALNSVQAAKSTLHGFIKRRLTTKAKQAGSIYPQSKEKVKKHRQLSEESDFKQFTPPYWADPDMDIKKLIG